MATALVKHVKEISTAPKHIHVLRDLVVQLAVEGKLVHRSESDGFAKDLLVEIEAARRTAINTGVFRKQKPIPSLDEDVSAEYPASWVTTCMAALGEIAPRNDINDEQDVSFFPMPLIPTVIGATTNGEVRKWKEIKKGFTHVANGDIALGKITPCFQNRKSCVFEGLESGMGAGTTELHVMRPVAGLVEPKFLLLILKSPKFIRIGKEKMTGTAGQQRVPRDYFAYAPIGLPPLPEQKRIVTKVDELMALIDDLEQKQNHREEFRQKFQSAALDELVNAEGAEELAEAWGRAQENWPALSLISGDILSVRNAVLDLAVRGRLVRHDLKSESGILRREKLIEEKSAMQKAGHVPKSKKVPEIDLEETPYEIYHSWYWARAEELCQVIVDCPHSTPKFVSQGIQCLDTNGFKQHKLIAARIRHVTEQTFDERVKRLIPMPGDIVFAREGSVGEAVVIPEGMKCCLGQRVMLFRPMPRISSDFLLLTLSNPSFLDRLLALHKGIGARHVNVGDMRKALIPVPPFDEQKRIAAKVDELMNLCEELEEHLKNKEELGNRLAEAVVAAA